MSTDTKFQTWNYEDLLLTVATNLSFRWNDEKRGSEGFSVPGVTQGAFWYPSFQIGEQLRPLGDIVTNHRGNLKGLQGVLLVASAVGHLPTRANSGVQER